MKKIVIPFLISLVSCTTPPIKQYGFLTTLGQDTISLESITRQGNTFTSDEVDRFPIVRVRHTVVNLDDIGGIRRLEMNIYTPSEPAGQRERTVIADVANHTVHLSKTDSTGTVKRDFPAGSTMVVAHVQQMYSMYELYFAAASKRPPGSSLELRQFYIDREFDRFPLGHATVKVIDSSRMEVTHDWLSGIGEAIMDSGTNLTSYSGDRTTYKVRVKRLPTLPDIKVAADRFEAKEKKDGGVRNLSVHDSTGGQIGQAILSVEYSRPLLRGRTLLGDVIPYDRIWRTGANAATQFRTSAPIRIGGLQVPAGTYTLFTAPHTTGTELIVNRQTGEWGTEYNGSMNLGTVRMISEVAATPVEAFTISVIPGDNRHGKLVLEWGTFRWIAPIEVE